MAYTYRIPVRFGDCDPAGIVFYPRYFEMLNATAEAFFAEALGYPFWRIHVEEGCGVPTAHLEADFRAPSRLGEVLTFTLDVVRIGGSSAAFETRVSCEGVPRMTARQVIVWTGLGLKPARWPEELRAALAAHLTGEGAT